jgi:hypothetical protein
MSAFGKAIRAIKTILMVIALSLLAGMAVASDEEPYPIWWSPELELESLEKVDERLERPFRPGDEGFVMDKWDDGQVVAKDHAPNCATMINLDEKGYSPTGGSNGIAIQAYHMAECEALRYLKNAQPAKRSYLARFVLDRKAFQFLPHMAFFGPSCSSACWTYFANEERCPMGEPEPLTELEVISDHEMEFKTDLDDVDLAIRAQADFNGDGLDDILLRSSVSVLHGTWAWTELFLLTRDAPDGVMWVLNAEHHLCTGHQCDPAYYYDRE